MSRISRIIAFQTKKSNLERDLHKETDIKPSVIHVNSSCFFTDLRPFKPAALVILLVIY